MIRLLLIATALLGGGSAVASGGTCGRDLFMAEAALRQTAGRLERAGEAQAERCSAWRHHANILRQVAGTYDRCLDGRARAEQAESLKAMAAEFDGLIRLRCR